MVDAETARSMPDHPYALPPSMESNGTVVPGTSGNATGTASPSPSGSSSGVPLRSSSPTPPGSQPEVEQQVGNGANAIASSLLGTLMAVVLATSLTV